MSLTYKLNNGKIEVPQFTKFQDYLGAIPETVGGMKKDGRAFAGGNIVLKERLEALISGNEESIEAWGENYFCLADACLVFEDKVKFQSDSPLLMGIRGVVKTQDGLYIAIDAKDVQAATTRDGWNYFKKQYRKAEKVNYRKGEENHQEIFENVVLLPYDKEPISLTPDQFRAIDGDVIKRKDIIYGVDMIKREIVKDGKIIHPAWKIYSPEVVVPFVNETFEFNKMKYCYDTNMALFLPKETANEAQLRPLGIFTNYRRSHIFDVILALGSNRLIGVNQKTLAESVNNRN